MSACDKTDGQFIWNGGRDSFGGNHGGAGGHVLRVGGSVAWHNAKAWLDSSGRAEILNGVTLGYSRYPDNLAGR